MKKHEWDNGNKMRFESPHKTFNRQTNCLSTGNVIANTQYSNYIRPYSEIECNGFTNAPGHLQNWDLTENIVSRMPHHIREEIRQLTHDDGGIIYNFHHWGGGYHGKCIVDGFVLTTRHDDYKLIEVWYINRDWRAMGAVDEAIKYITN